MSEYGSAETSTGHYVGSLMFVFVVHVIVVYHRIWRSIKYIMWKGE